VVQSILPTPKSDRGRESTRRLGFEIAFPLTILMFIVFSELSPMLKSYLERIVVWLIDHDFAFTAIEVIVLCIPLWMIGVIFFERCFRK